MRTGICWISCCVSVHYPSRVWLPFVSLRGVSFETQRLTKEYQDEGIPSCYQERQRWNKRIQGAKSGDSPIHIQPNAVAIWAQNLTIFVPKTVCLPRIIVTIRIWYRYDIEILDNDKHYTLWEEKIYTYEITEKVGQRMSFRCVCY